MNKKEVVPFNIIQNTVAGYLAALLRRISKNWGTPKLQPIPVKAKN